MRDYGKYSAYAVFLILPSDEQAVKYLTEYGQELDLLSGSSCLTIVFGESGPPNPSFDKHHWDSSTQEHVSKGYSLRMAEMFNINYSQFPCMLVFEDVRSADHVVILLKDMSQREIAETMRLAFAVIKEADLNNKNPLNELNERNRIDAYRKASQSVISSARNLGSKTLESAIEAIIKGAIS